MGYRTILVHFNEDRRFDSLIEVSTALATRFEAHLIGVYVIPQPLLLYDDLWSAGVVDIVDQIKNQDVASAQRLASKFEAATRSLAQGGEWRSVVSTTANVASELINCARSVDLIVASQADPTWYRSPSMDVPDRLAIESGRPTLIISGTVKTSIASRRITVAWNGRREAARAVFDALPLLKQAEIVHVVSVGPSVDHYKEGELPGTEMCRSLIRHGVKCEGIWVEGTNANAGAELLRRADANGSDLLVMGAYGHSRAWEFVMGGASEHVLANASIPVLFSH